MYSQQNEEQYILEAVKGIERGRLMDIGAWDPKCFSNSRALIEQGWSALLIEPSPGPLANLIREYESRRDIQILGAAVGVEYDYAEFAITDDAVSQPIGDRLTKWVDTGGFYGRLTVPVIQVKALFAHFGGDFEFVSIDTEGTSVDVFAAMCDVGVRPRCVVVEHDSRFVELSQHAEKANYRMIHENGTNRVYQWTGKRES